MRVTKRGGAFEEVNFEKIAERIKKLSWNLSTIDASLIVAQVASSLVDGITTENIDHLTAEVAISKNIDHPDYGKLAARIAMSNIHKKTSDSVFETFERMASALNPSFMDLVRRYDEELQEMIEYKRDYDFDFFGIKTLERMYCTKIDGVLVERPQHVYLRVALALCGQSGDMQRVKETYDLLSKKYFTHASPTLFNAGMTVQQISSCFLDASDDSLDGIFNCFHRCANISKFGGGLGISVSSVRSKGAPIRSTNGVSDGIIPMLKVANSVTSYVNQCFVPETPVHSARGIIRMDRVEVGDSLVTRDGTYRKVNEVFVRHVINEPMFTLVTKIGSEGITCTGVHEIYRLRGSSTDFCHARDLVVGDYLGFPIPTSIVDQDFSEDQCRSYGYALGHGHVSFDYRYLHLPRAKTLQVIRGVLETAGRDMPDVYIVTSSSRDVLLGLRSLCLRHGVLTDMYHHALYIPKHPGLCGAADFIPDETFDFFERDGIVYVPLTDITRSRYTGNVYDFNMESNHNYTTGGGLVHNSGKRHGSMAVYLEPHHPDVLDFLNLRRPGGDEEMRCRDLFLAMWVSDEFMRRVEAGESWSLMDPYTCPGLGDVYGDEFTALYTRYENEGKAVKVVNARDVWTAMLTSQIESGVPYILNKDACNTKTNQKNLGVIKNSNLCVAPETRVLTRQGHVRISDVCDTSVEVWNGMEWSDVVVKKTSDRAELMKISFDDGNVLECTPYHKFYVRETYWGPAVERRANELVPGDLLIDWDAPPSEPFRSGDVTVRCVERTGRMDATYCFNEPKRHMGIFNGVITGNCAEIVEYSAPGEEVAVCTLASIGLPAFIRHGVFDFDELHRVTKIVARNLDTAIDVNHYPIEEARVSNMRHRPLGIGIQGLADTYIKLKLPFDSHAANVLNRRILATMYHAALEMSTELAELHGTYPSYDGSPASQGLLQYDLWNVTPVEGLDWNGLKRRIGQYGLRNSLSIALMPTASTAQLLGNSEAAEPVTSFYYVRRTLAGEYACIHKYLLRELVNRGLWTPEIKNALVRDGGSIQNILEIPKELRDIYKTSWDIKQRHIIDQAAARGPYVCQSQSMNLFVAAPTFAKLTAMHFHSWKAGLKTINYYLRSKPASKAAQVTVDACVQCSA
jgi:ribonucleotide reductase alpha subunit